MKIHESTHKSSTGAAVVSFCSREGFNQHIKFTKTMGNENDMLDYWVKFHQINQNNLEHIICENEMTSIYYMLR
jgi:hypothetical protein